MEPRSYAWALVFVPLLGCSALDPDGGAFGGTCGVSTAAPDVGPWDVQAAAFEASVLELTNQRRAEGGCCGSAGCFARAPALAHSDNLQVAARLHAKDMAERSYFSHDSPGGRSLLDRLESAGFGGCRAGENIARGQETPETVIDSWMASDGHCANVLSPRFDALGVGYYDDPNATEHHYWVQDFGG